MIKIFRNKTTELQKGSPKIQESHPLGQLLCTGVGQQEDSSMIRYVKADLLECNDDLKSLNKALFKFYNEAHT